MRFATLFPLTIKYTNLLHAHSHVAFQGWAYLSLFYLLTTNFISQKNIEIGKYKLQYKITIVVVLGILISFILQGYGLYSIIFSSLFQIMSYWFMFRFLKDLNQENQLQKQPLSIKFIKAALWLNFISTLAPWGIGIISANGLSGSEVYHSTIYFFLHFQYNGWFTFAILGIFFKLLEKHELNFDNIKATYFYYFLLLSVLPAYTLSLLGMSFKNSIIILAYFAAFVQLIAAFYFFSSLKKLYKIAIKKFNAIFYWLIIISFSSFILKLIIQSLSVLEIFQPIAFSNRFIIMSFIHMVLIGFVSIGILAIMKSLNYINKKSTLSLIGMVFLLIGFLSSELFLVISGFNAILFLNELLVLSSLIMFLGIVFLLIKLK
jgi:hypothetical protein